MAVPAVVAVAIWGLRAWRAYQTYESAMTATELAQMTADIARRKQEVPRVLKEAIEKLAQEIDVKSSTFAPVDPGGNILVSRRGTEVKEFKEYIERKLPFRPAISVVCKLAEAMPIKVPRRIRKKIPGDVVESTIEVALKQTTASLMFESVDEVLDWESPLKAEPCYTRSGQPYLGEPNTRPKRIGTVFPFWPRPRGSIAPDLVIVEYRQQSFEVPNVFAAVEIKFPNDWVKKDQLESYVFAMGKNEKKVALMRIPEDCVPRDTHGKDTDKSKPSSRTKRK